MKIAVLMSSYNGEKYIKEQIDSILHQTGNFTLDLWVRDDGSSDSTPAILEEYAKTGKLRWYSGSNLRSAKSFLHLLQNCKGYDFYAFADQDDYWQPDKLSCALQALANKPGMQLYFSNAELVDAKLHSLGRNVYRQTPKLDLETLSCAGGILGCTIVFNAELAKAVQEKPMPQKVIMHDFYVSELCLALGGTITFDPAAHMKYRQHGDNVVGVSTSFFKIVASRLRAIFTRPEISIADQASVLLEQYENDMSDETKKWLTNISVYRENAFRRLCLATSVYTKYINKNMSLQLRCSLLLGNR